MKTRGAERLIRGVSPDQGHRFMVLGSGRDSLRGDGGAAKRDLSPAAVGTAVPQSHVPQRRHGVATVGACWLEAHHEVFDLLPSVQ